MKTIWVIVFFSLVAVRAQAQTPACDEWKARLKSEINAANGCESRHQRCLDMGPTNPMRELNYCQNLLNKCESLDGSFESEELKSQIERYRQQCS
jgi:hypothetical protein